MDIAFLTGEPDAGCSEPRAARVALVCPFTGDGRTNHCSHARNWCGRNG
jgi:hypothetical protein